MRKVLAAVTQVYIFADEKRSPDRIASRRNVSAIRDLRQREIVENPERMAMSTSKPLNEEKRKVAMHQLQFYLGPGNNSELVRRVLSHRSNWVEYADPKYTFINLRWQQSERGYKYENCIENKVFKQILNHLQFHAELSNKEYLLRNLSEYCEANKRNVFDIVPATFVLNLKESGFQNALYTFLRFFELNMPVELKAENRKLWVLIKGEHGGSYAPDRRSSYYYCKPTIPEVFIGKQSSYLWLLKPTFLNRGRGIHVFSNLESLEELISSYSAGRSESLKSEESPNRTTKPLTIKASSFVVQKYLERPMLINGRKFDIRVWVLINQDARVYFFREGYLRTSSESYSTGKDTLDNLYIHLTNNAVQKYNKSYSKHEVGNQLSFQHLRNLLTGYGISYDAVLSKIVIDSANMKDIIKLTMLSVRKKLNKLERLYCFEIFGYDFMLDEAGKAWLIEVNTNPCIEESSPLLAQLLPRMLDDAFKLTIDVMYPNPLGSDKSSRYVLPFYENTENVWELMLDLKRR